MLRFNNRNTRARCKICSNLTIKIPEQRQCCRTGAFIVNFEHISHPVLVFLLLTLGRFNTFSACSERERERERGRVREMLPYPLISNKFLPWTKCLIQHLKCGLVRTLQIFIQLCFQLQKAPCEHLNLLFLELP